MLLESCIKIRKRWPLRIGAAGAWTMPPAGESKAFTLIEVVVSIGILAACLAMAAVTMVQNLKQNALNQHRYEAIQAAQTILDNLRFVDIEDMSGTEVENITIGDATYEVTVTYCSIPEFCISEDIRHIAVGVRYHDALIYETDTVFSKL